MFFYIQSKTMLGFQDELNMRRIQNIFAIFEFNQYKLLAFEFFYSSRSQWLPRTY